MRLQPSSIVVASLAISSTSLAAPVTEAAPCTPPRSSVAASVLHSEHSESDVHGRGLGNLGDIIEGVIDGIPVLGPLVEQLGVDKTTAGIVDSVGSLVDGLLKKKSDVPAPIAAAGGAAGGVPSTVNSTVSGAPLPPPVAGAPGTVTGPANSTANSAASALPAPVAGAAGTAAGMAGSADPGTVTSASGGVAGNAAGVASNVTGALPANPLTVVGNAAGSATSSTPLSSGAEEIDIIEIEIPVSAANGTSKGPIPIIVSPTNITSHANGTGPGNATSKANGTATLVNGTVMGLPVSPALPSNPPNSPIAGMLDVEPNIFEILEVPTASAPVKPTPPSAAVSTNGTKPTVQPPVKPPVNPPVNPTGQQNASNASNTATSSSQNSSATGNATAPANSTEIMSNNGTSNAVSERRRSALKLRFNRRGLF